MSVETVSRQLLMIGKIPDPTVRMKSLVTFAMKHFAWGADPLNALLGPKAKNGRFCGNKLAQTGGGKEPELLELVKAAEVLKQLKNKESKKAHELRELLKREYSDVLMMIFAYGNQLGINADESLHEGCKKMIQRFDNILEFVRQGQVSLRDLKKPKLFQELWTKVKECGVYAAQIYTPQHHQAA